MSLDSDLPRLGIVEDREHERPRFRVPRFGGFTRRPLLGFGLLGPLALGE
jgi:hypothetical protein